MVHDGHLPEAVARIEGLKEVVLPAPRFQNVGAAHLQGEHRVPLVELAEEKLARRHRYDRAQAEQELEDLRLDPAKDWHSLQKFDPRFLHGAPRRRRGCDLPDISLARPAGRSRVVEEPARGIERVPLTRRRPAPRPYANARQAAARQARWEHFTAGLEHLHLSPTCARAKDMRASAVRALCGKG